MPRKRLDTREHIIEAAYRLFYKSGFATVGVDAIAEAADITKRTLYYHFDSKQSLIAAVLAAQSELALAQIEHWAGSGNDGPLEVVENLFSQFAAWASQPRWRSSGFTRAAMEFAAQPGHPARLAARRHKASVEVWLAARFAEGGIKTSAELARQVMLLIEGCHSLILVRGDPSYASTAARAAKALVAAAK
jgi:AcrR family transcriptional regulator